MKDTITVISVGKPYDIPGENGAPGISGCTMWYLPTADMKPSFNEHSELLGFNPVKERMGVDFYERAKKIGIPAVAEVEFGQTTKNGELKLYIMGLDFIAEKQPEQGTLPLDGSSSEHEEKKKK